MLKRAIFFITILVLSGYGWAQMPAIHHEMAATVDPGNHSVKVTDKITIPVEMIQPQLHFMLDGNLAIDPVKGITLQEGGDMKAADFGMDQEDFEQSHDSRQKHYIINLPDGHTGAFTFTLTYHGKIYYEIKQMSEEYARNFSTSPGIISEEGVYLGGSSYWVPWFNEELITFNLDVNLPQGWDAVSQGKRASHTPGFVRWESPELMEEIFLIAAKFHYYEYSVGAVKAMAYLRTPDESLANKYLETTAQYLEMYRQLVGSYPFSKFALVENFWETGYGMPSFTLLGEKIIRFPFILHSSYPHELLHNWWGNSVYVDFETGNWCEGLTAYMADHLIKEQRGQGAEYRRSTLQRYTDYVKTASDFPLTDFRSRHSAATEAVGYGKSQMLWHMLRREYGDDNFRKGFQRFNRDFKFKRASFTDIQHSFESVTNAKLQSFFDQWVRRTGAPELELGQTAVSKTANGKRFILNYSLRQVQPGELYDIRVPLAIYTPTGVVSRTIRLNEREVSDEVSLESEPVRLEIDPEFDVFRRLHYAEIPPALSKVFGADLSMIVLPSGADPERLAAYRELAKAWGGDDSQKIQVVLDSDVTDFPADRAVWLFGKENKLFARFASLLSDYDLSIENNAIRFGANSTDRANMSFVISARHPADPNSVVVWLDTDVNESIAGLGRKLPHYGKYSYLAFEGDEPANTVKGQWPAVGSPLSRVLSKTTLPEDVVAEPRKALAELNPVFNSVRMLDHVKYLASEELAGRMPGTPGVEKAAEYIAEQFKAAGLEPGGDNGSWFQEFTIENGPQGKPVTTRNVVAVLPGTNPDMAGESAVLCAHYDHLGTGWPDAREGNEGKIHYGADDNASGVSVMLELAATLGKTLKPQRSIIFVAFSGEEAGLLGSRYYVKNSKTYPADKIIGALNLDTVGRLANNKLLVLNGSSAREWRFIFMGSSYVTGVESEVVTQELDASDQVAFIEAGIPAVQFFSGPNPGYHSPEDTYDKIDGDGLVKVAAFVREAVVYLGEREGKMTFLGQAKTAGKPQGDPAGGRSVSTGTVPDFTFTGEGVRVSDVTPDSPGAKAGLKAGDIIIKVDDDAVNSLRDYSTILKQHQPGDNVNLTVIRDGSEMQIPLVLGSR
jgi:aminopeptidase N